VRIPDGDLMPARRRGYRGGYGRRRRRRTRRLALVVVVLLVAAAAAWFFRREDHPGTQVLSTCPTPTATTSPAALPANVQVRFVLLNGTPRNGLAQLVGQALRARGFVVLSQANAPTAVGGPSVVTYGPGAQQAATVLARNVLGARVVAAPTAGAGTLQLVLGGDFQRLATPAEVIAAGRTGAAVSAVPEPTRTPCAA